MSPDKHSLPHVVVVGGGVAGLATAFLIRELGREAGRDCRVTVLEAQDRAGGSTRTDTIDGFLCEWGPNGFLDNEPATLELVKRLGLTERLVPANETAALRYIYHSGKLHEVPVKPPAFLASDILPLSAKLRMALEILIPARRNGREETVHDFGVRRLGIRFADYLLDPMVSGIFAGNTRELSLPAVFPKMVEMERDYGGLFRALIKKQREAKRNGTVSGGPSGAHAILQTFRNGMGELTDTLTVQLGDAICVQSPVEAIARRDNAWRVQSNIVIENPDAVVVACPSYAAAKMIESLSPTATQSLNEIPYAPVDVVCHGYAVQDIDHSLRGFGVLIPRSEGIRSLGSLWCNSIFPGQAPEGMHLLRTLMGGAHDPQIVELSENELNRIADQDHNRLFRVHNSPRFRRIIRHARGIAQYTIGHIERVAAAEQLEREVPGLFFTGASYRGVSINGCAKDAFRVAREFWKQQGIAVV
ncbi:MAG: protoporphyrinogen oxidase [Calditrichota bacterium]